MGLSAAAVTAWASAFLFTQFIEIPIYLHMLGDRKRTNAAAIAAGASFISHPLLWFVGWPVMKWLYLAIVSAEPRLAVANVQARYAMVVIPLEVCVVILEGLYLWRVARVPKRQAFSWSLIANTSSLVIGMVLRSSVHWL